MTKLEFVDGETNITVTINQDRVSLARGYKHLR